MDFNKRVQDVSQVFERNYKVNNDYQGRQDAINKRNDHFKRMYNIQNKTNMRKEVLRANSVNGQVESLNNRMQAMTSNQNRMKMNDFKNNFR